MTNENERRVKILYEVPTQGYIVLIDEDETLSSAACGQTIK